VIRRAPRPTSNFYVLDKAISEDSRLGWVARGMLIFLLGKPDNWTVSAAALVNETAKAFRSTGRDGVYASLRELKDAGYLRALGERSNGGTFSSADYLVVESPHTDFPDVVDRPDTENPNAVLPEQPLTDLPYPANPTQVRIEKKQGLKKEQGLKRASAPIFRSVPKKPEDVTPQTWADWLQLRKGKRAAVTQTVIDEARREADKAGLSLERFLVIWCARGSQSLEAQWLKPSERCTAVGSTPAVDPDARSAVEAEVSPKESARGTNFANSGPPTRPACVACPLANPSI
jgi:hypothetical protein